jgi:predicted CoA-substrate-specific enzyme activase
MISAGIDVGAATAKAVILKDGQVVSSFLLPTGRDVARSSQEVINKSLRRARLRIENLDGIVSTGYGRNSVSFAQKAVTEILCHGKGARFLFPEVRMVIDIGGQDSKVILLGNNGEVKDFIMNDKCAAGTGRFLEVMATVLDLKIEEMGAVSLRSKSPCQITSTCTVFAESEVVSLRAVNNSVEDIVAGIHQSVAKRVAAMAKTAGIAEPVLFTGGVARNSGVQRCIENELGVKLIIPKAPQLAGALGAAIFASEIMK